MDKLLERIAYLESKVASESAKAEGYFDMLQEANARAAGLEQDLRVASMLHRTQPGRLMMRPFRLCCGGPPRDQDERQAFNPHAGTSNGRVANHGLGNEGGGSAMTTI